MLPPTHLELAYALLPAVIAAGAVELEHFNAGVEVEHKADRSPVTAADREAEAILLAALSTLAPDVPVIAEEAASAGLAPLPKEDGFFLVDPLDGTREFIKQGKEFTVNIGFIRHGRPMFGLIYAPALDVLYVTTGPEAAVVIRDVATAGGRPRVLEHADVLRTRAPDPQNLVALESRTHKTAGLAGLLTRHAIGEKRRAGSSLKFCLVAEGSADVYARFGDTSEWDTAAGEAILAAAGGSVSGLEGQPLVYGKPASGYLNPSFIAWGRRPAEPW